jgi:hypothetical protein
MQLCELFTAWFDVRQVVIPSKKKFASGVHAEWKRPRRASGGDPQDRHARLRRKNLVWIWWFGRRPLTVELSKPAEIFPAVHVAHTINVHNSGFIAAS